MKKEDFKIHIIGAGVSGLIAAKVLESSGYKPVIFEASNDVGGRVKTDIVEGYQLDHGFQVLLTDYPLAKKYLDYELLELQKFVPGAVVYKQKKKVLLGDPLRDLSLLFPTLFSDIGTLADKLRIFRLNTRLKSKSLKLIFEEEETSTKAYLESKGFSNRIIGEFFKPFFSGIFLESKLATSSRMFEFVYKMFGNGYATIPKKGIHAIPRQLSDGLQHTRIHLNTKVKSVENKAIVLHSGKKYESDLTIIATEAGSLINRTHGKFRDWKSCQTLYFTANNRPIKKPVIGLIADDFSLINNLFYHTSLAMSKKGDKELLSVTVVREHALTDEKLIEEVKKELEVLCGISDVEFLKLYNITKALPNNDTISYENTLDQIRVDDTIILAGDVLLNGSLNAAMASGEKAAEYAIELMTDKLN